MANSDLKGSKGLFSAHLLASARTCEADEAKYADFVPTHDLDQWHHDKAPGAYLEHLQPENAKYNYIILSSYREYVTLFCSSELQSLHHGCMLQE